MNHDAKDNPVITEFLQLVERLRQSAQDSQKTIADIENMLNILLKNSNINLQNTGDIFSHSPDFRSIYYKSSKYSLTTAQASCVQILYEQWKNKTPEISAEYILTTIGYYSQRLSDLFKKHSAWGKLIISGNTRGTYRLNIAD